MLVRLVERMTWHCSCMHGRGFISEAEVGEAKRKLLASPRLNTGASLESKCGRERAL